MDVAYGSDPAQQLDIYPAAGRPHGLVAYLHGGGFVTGNRRGGRLLSGPLNQAGYTLACVGYRLMPQTDLAGCLADAAQAIGYLLSKYDELGSGQRTCVIMGHSAGGHMAALLAANDTYLLKAGVSPHSLRAIIALDGIFDLTSFLAGNTRLLRRDVYGSDPAAWQKYSSVTYVGSMAANPRFCLMYEDSNRRFVEQASIFEGELKRHNKTVVSAVAHGLKHAQLMLSFKCEEHPMLAFTLRNLAASF